MKSKAVNFEGSVKVHVRRKMLAIKQENLVINLNTCYISEEDL